MDKTYLNKRGQIVKIGLNYWDILFAIGHSLWLLFWGSMYIFLSINIFYFRECIRKWMVGFCSLSQPHFGDCGAYISLVSIFVALCLLITPFMAIIFMWQDDTIKGIKKIIEYIRN